MIVEEMYREDWRRAVDKLAIAAGGLVDGRDLRTRDRLTVRCDKLSELEEALDELREAEKVLDVRGIKP